MSTFISCLVINCSSNLGLRNGHIQNLYLLVGLVCLVCLHLLYCLPIANCQLPKQNPQLLGRGKGSIKNQEIAQINEEKRGFLREIHYLYNIHTLYYSAKDCVLVIKPRSSNSGDEKLRAISIGTRICHGESEGPVMS